MSDQTASNPWAAAAPSTPPAAEANPWATPAAAAPEPAAVESTAAAPANPWGGAAPSPAEAPAAANGDWLGAPPEAAPEPPFDWVHPFNESVIPLDTWVDQGLNWVVDNFRPFFQAVRLPIDATLTGIEQALLAVPAFAMILLFGLIAWQVSGRRLGIASVLSLIVIGLIGAWDEAMVTLSLVLTSVFFCMVIGLPTGIIMARNDKLEGLARPVLDAMQTTPAFVYLVPVVMLFGIGNVPGVVVTIVFALPPLIRLTNLGIRQVRPDLIEASRAFGASPWQLLTRVQLPLAMPTIMAGINQTLMLGLSMVVIASMIAVGGLGQMVLRGIGRLDMGLATIGGLGIVILAIMLDRITQAMAGGKTSPGRWYDTGPIGAVRRLLGKSAAA
ncbi:MAG: glycine betaine/L-proline ABC transporter permease ProW [Denitromonas halophila]|jgi:glycine betaine/proline transport system permease protein|nr:MAG: glycine betaine/L-proline ABC transporter permease ProW [Denitromonas halophila]TVT71324.1 MAG: glycine betaine/L-proline ABC transporter permease ProW [Denitromonas halophila]TVT72195.1 MAG: glycine betaine/L-proline ABC transporter permease ProW [Denitromonas halophila]